MCMILTTSGGSRGLLTPHEPRHPATIPAPLGACSCTQVQAGCSIPSTQQVSCSLPASTSAGLHLHDDVLPHGAADEGLVAAVRVLVQQLRVGILCGQGCTAQPDSTHAHWLVQESSAMPGGPQKLPKPFLRR